jgi:hypothetical protein
MEIGVSSQVSFRKSVVEVEERTTRLDEAVRVFLFIKFISENICALCRSNKTHRNSIGFSQLRIGLPILPRILRISTYSLHFSTLRGVNRTDE